MTVDGDWLPPAVRAPRRARRVLAALAMTAGLALLTGCGAPIALSQPSPTATETPTPTPTPTPTATPVAAAEPSPAPTTFEEMTLEQRVGQLFIVGTPATAAGAEALSAVKKHYVGGVFLAGRSELGVDATRAVVDQLTAASGSAFPLFVATDQEGGEVQVLRGPGFSEIPSALEQGTRDVATLTADAEKWGAELAAAGVNFNLAPVSDVLDDPATASNNAPIGYFHREFGFDRSTVEDHAGAVIAGMHASGVITSFKHFPGLGLVVDNTDTTAGVTDTLTDKDSPSVKVAATLIAQGAPCVMMSTADYDRLDPGMPAAFSHKIVTGLLRETLGFEGCIITDDVSAAAQIAAWSPGQRAILAIEAGVDLVLVSASPELAPEMIAAVVKKAESDPGFAAKVDVAVRRVLLLKSTLGPSGTQ